MGNSTRCEPEKVKTRKEYVKNKPHAKNNNNLAIVHHAGNFVTKKEDHDLHTEGMKRYETHETQPDFLPCRQGETAACSDMHNHGLATKKILSQSAHCQFWRLAK